MLGWLVLRSFGSSTARRQVAREQRPVNAMPSRVGDTSEEKRALSSRGTEREEDRATINYRGPRSRSSTQDDRDTRAFVTKRRSASLTRYSFVLRCAFVDVIIDYTRAPLTPDVNCDHFHVYFGFCGVAGVARERCWPRTTTLTIPIATYC